MAMCRAYQEKRIEKLRETKVKQLFVHLLLVQPNASHVHIFFSFEPAMNEIPFAFPIHCSRQLRTFGHITRKSRAHEWIACKKKSVEHTSTIHSSISCSFIFINNEFRFFRPLARCSSVRRLFVRSLWEWCERNRRVLLVRPMAYRCFCEQNFASISSIWGFPDFVSWGKTRKFHWFANGSFAVFRPDNVCVLLDELRVLCD